MRNNLKKILKYTKRTGAILSTAVALRFLSPEKGEAQDIVKKINPKSRQEVVDKSYGVGDINGDGVADERDYFDIPPGFFEESLSKISTGCIAPKDYCDAMLNPYFQPNDSTLKWYGSGDVRRDNVLDSLDVIAMQSGDESDEADVDGDGIPSTAQDQQELSDRLDGTRPYLRGEWNHLESGLERDYWNDATLEVDLRDTLTWTFPDWISADFAALGYFEGFSLPDTTNMPERYKQYYDIFGRYNMPMYFVAVLEKNSLWGHGMNAILIGKDSSNADYSPLNIEDWNFVEPQDDSTHISPGTESIPFDTYVQILGIERFKPNGATDFYSIVTFDVDSLGNSSLFSYNEDLITERPTISVSTEEPTELLSKYKLSQNFPNPFNSSTKIKFQLREGGYTSLVIYDIMGREVTKLIEREMPSGRHKIQWHAKDVTSGVYLYRLKTGNFVQTNKMVLLR